MFETVCSIAPLFFAIIGIVTTMLAIMFRLMVWREEGFTAVIAMKGEKDGVSCRIRHLREIFEFLGVHKKCKIAVINYGASSEFCKKLLKEFDNGEFINIVNASDKCETLFTQNRE